MKNKIHGEDVSHCARSLNAILGFVIYLRFADFMQPVFFPQKT